LSVRPPVGFVVLNRVLTLTCDFRLGVHLPSLLFGPEYPCHVNSYGMIVIGQWAIRREHFARFRLYIHMDAEEDGHSTLSGPSSTGVLTDEDIVRRVGEGEVALFEVIMRRYNRRLYRIARAILKDDMESEDAVQEAYLNALAHLGQFAGRASFGTWLVKITVNEACKRAVRRTRMEKFEGNGEVEWSEAAIRTTGTDVEHEVAVREVTTVLEGLIDELPEHLRTVFVLRDVEQLSPAETAQALDIREITVRTRLHRARRHLRKLTYAHFGEAVLKVFEFGSWRCDHIVEVVMSRFGQCV
jgi:RNA polymerase sigma-70 factor (ECF subfamily)